ncbi:MAG: hypothetical protein DWQ01_08670 [Planctomycetota bacterium]|nr:MAG: hypothetical protein DWQ01_08670 [Planctomycetota bacterium]
MVATLDQKIPFTYRRKKADGTFALYVRASLRGRRAVAPLSNDWLKSQGLRPVKDLIGRAAAVHAALLKKLEGNLGKPVVGRIRLSAAIEDFLDAHENLASFRQISRSQRNRRRSVLVLGANQRKSFLDFMRDPLLDQIEARDLRRFEAYIERLGYSQESLRSYLADVRRFLAWCVQTEILAVDPCSAGRYTLPPGAELREEESGYPVHFVDTLLKVSRSFPTVHRAVMVVSLSGLRRGEHLRLTRESIQGHALLIAGARKNRRRQLAYRMVPIPTKLQHFLGRLVLKPGAFVATGTTTPLSEAGIRSAVRRFTAKTGIHFSLQRLRRTYAQRLRDLGLEEGIIARRMGNSPRTLKRWYVVPSAEPLTLEEERALTLGTVARPRRLRNQ